MWHSLVVRMVRDHEAAGSNPVTPTKPDYFEPAKFSNSRVSFYMLKIGNELKGSIKREGRNSPISHDHKLFFASLCVYRSTVLVYVKGLKFCG